MNGCNGLARRLREVCVDLISVSSALPAASECPRIKSSTFCGFHGEAGARRE
jgi:hypothetical protein